MSTTNDGWVEERGGGWLLKVAGTRGILVHHHVDHGKDTWVVTFHELGIRAMPLRSKDVAEARAEARKLIRGRLARLLRVVDEAPKGEPAADVAVVEVDGELARVWRPA